MAKIYRNGIYCEQTEDEIAEIKARNQKELLENASSYNLTSEDILMILAQSISITLPTGEQKPASDMINTSIDLPFKLGQKWVLEGTAFVLKDDPDAIGTAENPIIYYDGVQLIDNAYYLIDGVRNVYMSDQFVAF